MLLPKIAALRDTRAKIARLEKEVAAWEQDRNNRSAAVDWRFTTENARIKLKRLYPKL